MDKFSSFLKLADTNIGGLQNHSTKIFGMPNWLFFILGALILLIGILSFFLYPKTKRKSQEYKQEQLKEYKKQNKINEKVNIEYEKTGMYLPAWERAKMSAPLIFGLVFATIGISWLIGGTLLL